MIVQKKQSGYLCITFLLLLILFIVFASHKTARAAYDTVTLSDAGWSNPAAGTWDPATKTGVLTQDMIGTIQITSSGITLDGAGHSITGDGTNNGVYVDWWSDITIKNLLISGCKNGMMLQYTNNNTVSGNIISNNVNADLYLFEASNNVISGNQITDSDYAGLLLREFANDNTIRDNIFSGNALGVTLQGVKNNIVYHNTVQDNTSTGIYITDTPSALGTMPSRFNLIYQNNFIGNATHAYVFKYWSNNDNRFFLNIPDGGNYWSGYVAADNDTNGIADAPFVFTGGRDGFPWMVQNGWEAASGNPPTSSYIYVYLRDDGWSEPVGTWDSVSRTASLTQDINGSIIVAANDVILEGNGYTIRGNGNAIGIQMIGHGHDTIRNIHTENYDYGIYFDYGYDSSIENCTAADSRYGMYLVESRMNRIADCDELGNDNGIVLSTLSDGNTLIGNLIQDNDCGIDIPGSFDNIILQNAVRFNTAYGIRLREQPYNSNALQPNRNQVYSNDFIQNGVQISVVTMGTDNIFNLAAPIGGNYWDNHVSSDVDTDGFADTPYVFSVGQDNLPFIVPFNWHLDSLPIIITLSNYITSPTNQDITVYATTNKGTLNAGSYTFTSNGSFDFIATDGVGNTVTRTVTITNIDKEPPVLTLIGPSEVVVEAGTDYLEEGVRAFDNSVGDITYAVIVNDNIDINTSGVYFVQYEVSDRSGNNAAISRTVIVADTTKPSLSVPDDVEVILTGPLTQVDLGTATADDLFPVDITNDAPPEGFKVGTTLVTWTATDSNGNKSTMVQKVSVIYIFSGFKDPIDPNGSNTFKSGRIIPIKFDLKDAQGAYVSTATAKLSYVRLPEQDSEAIITKNIFKYDSSTNQYTTKMSTKGFETGSYILTVTLDDGESYSVDIRLE